MKLKTMFLSCAMLVLLLMVAFVPATDKVSALGSASFLKGDFDGDNDRDGDDIDLMTAYADLSVGFEPKTDLEKSFDLVKDNWVDLYDILEWLKLGTLPATGPGNGGTVIGDADLDGDVDREDLEILEDSIAQSNDDVGVYTLGDFDGSGTYDFNDLSLWSRGSKLGL